MRVLTVLLLLGIAGGVYSLWSDSIPSGSMFSGSEPPLQPHDPRLLTGDKKIIMVAADWCGYCRKQQKDFEMAKVRYRVLDYDTAEGKRASKAMGTRGVPITIIGQNIVAGYRPEELQSHLAPLGYDVY